MRWIWLLCLGASVALAASTVVPGPTPQRRVESNGGIAVTNDGGSWGLYVDAGFPVQYSTANIALEVDPLGSDSNACTAVGASACLTLQGALNKLPKELRNTATITMAAGNYAGAIVQGFRAINTTNTQAGLKIVGTLVTATVATGSATGTATSATSGSNSTATHSTLTNSSAIWTTDDLKGKLLEITSGTGVGQIYPITGNTSTTITVAAGGWSGVPSTSGYAVRDWGSVITSSVTIPAALDTTEVRTAGLMFVDNIGSANANSYLVDSVKINPATATYGVTFQGVPNTKLIRCKVQTAAGTVVQVEHTGFSTIARSVIYYPTGTPVGIAINSGAFTLTQSLVWGNTGSNGFLIDSGTATGIPVISVTQSRIDSVAFGLKIQGPSDTALAGVRFYNVASQAIRLKTTNAVMGGAVVRSTSGVDISNALTAVEVDGPSSAQFTGQLTGTGNTTVARIDFGGYLYLSNTSTITGTTEIDMDGQLTGSFGQIAATSCLSTAQGSRVCLQ